MVCVARASARRVVHTETLSTRHGLSDPPTTCRFQQPARHHEVELVNIDPALSMGTVRKWGAPISSSEKVAVTRDRTLLIRGLATDWSILETSRGVV